MFNEIKFYPKAGRPLKEGKGVGADADETIVNQEILERTALAQNIPARTEEALLPSL